MKCDTEIRAFEQYFPVVVFIMPFAWVVSTSESVNETLKCGLSNES